MGKKITNIDKKNIDKKLREENNGKYKKIIISIICVVLIIATIIPTIGHFSKNNKILDTETYVTVGDNKYNLTRTQYSFYYTLTINNFCSIYGDYLSVMGLDLTKDLSAQYYDKENNITWRDYFMTLTNTLVQTTYTLYDLSKENNYINKDTSYYDAFLASIKQDAKTQKITYEEQLQTTFYETMTPSVFEDELKIYALSLNYSEYLKEKIKTEITDAEYEEYYINNKDNCDTVYYRAFLIEYNKDAEENNFEKDIFTKETAETICKNVGLATNEEEFIKFAKENAEGSFKELYQNENYTKGTVTGKSAALLSVADWLYSADRKPNDIQVIHDETNNRYFTIQFIARERDERQTANFRHILLTYDYYKQNGKTDSELTIAANAIYSNLEKSGFKESDFISYANSYSEDEAVDGLYENIVENTLAEDIDNWIFDENRKPGDCSLIKSDNNYHVLYFKEFDVPYWKAYVRQTLLSEKYAATVDENLKKYKLTFADGKIFNSLDKETQDSEKNTETTNNATEN